MLISTLPDPTTTYSLATIPLGMRGFIENMSRGAETAWVMLHEHLTCWEVLHDAHRTTVSLLGKWAIKSQVV